MRIRLRGVIGVTIPYKTLEANMAYRRMNFNKAKNDPTTSRALAVSFFCMAPLMPALYFFLAKNFIYQTRQFIWMMTVCCWGYCAIMLAFGIYYALHAHTLTKREAAMKAKIFDLTAAGVPAEEFLKNRALLTRNGDITGVYVLHNIADDKYYVGQSVRIIDRVTQHLTGRGNGDVYADFKYGRTFTVALIPLNGSGFDSLNELESQTIKAYGAYVNGYNRTRGNRA